MGWESCGVVGFDLGPLLQGQMRIAKLKGAYNSLIIGPRGLGWFCCTGSAYLYIAISLLVPLSLFINLHRYMNYTSSIYPSFTFIISLILVFILNVLVL